MSTRAVTIRRVRFLGIRAAPVILSLYMGFVSHGRGEDLRDSDCPGYVESLHGICISWAGLGS